MKLLSALLFFILLFSCKEGDAQQWICTKQFKPYYVPGDYEVYVIKQPGMQDPNIVHDTIYVDSCRLRMEAEAKMFDSLKSMHDSNMLTDSTGTVSAGHYRTGGVQADGWISDPKFFIGTPSFTTKGKNGFRNFYHTKRIKGRTVYIPGRDRWHRAPKQKVVKKIMPTAKPKEIMVEITYFYNGRLLKTSYTKEYGMVLNNTYVTKNTITLKGVQKAIDSMHFRVFIPE